MSLLDETLPVSSIPARWTCQIPAAINGNPQVLADSKNVLTREMIAIGYQTTLFPPDKFECSRIIYSSTAPYSIVIAENFVSQSPFPMLDIRIRGLYIQSENDLVAAFIIVAPSDYKFYIANIDLFIG